MQLYVKVSDVITAKSIRGNIFANLESLIKSIDLDGLQHPIEAICDSRGDLFIVNGFRRAAAYSRLGREYIPVIVRFRVDKDGNVT